VREFRVVERGVAARRGLAAHLREQVAIGLERGHEASTHLYERGFEEPLLAANVRGAGFGALEIHLNVAKVGKARGTAMESGLQPGQQA